MDSATSWKQRYREYWEFEGQFRATDQLLATSFFVLVCQVAFIALDRWAYPEHFDLFFPARLGVNAVVLYILFYGRHRHPNASQLAIGLAVGAEILLMVYATGGPNSLYYTGLLLVFVGMPVLQPITVSGSLAVSGVCCAGFALTPLAVGPPDELRSFVIAMIFVLSGAFESAVSCHLLTRSRVRAFEQRREIENARDKLAELDGEKARFTANVHHELRTPLTLMLAPLEGMLGGDFGAVSPVQRGYMISMRSNALRLLKLINNLLDFAKIESGQLSINRKRVRVGALADELIAGARPMAEQKGVALHSASLDTLNEIHVDPDALEKILVNLIGNALKFTSSGQIEVSGTNRDDGGIHLVVADTGIGMPAGELGRVFDRFAQVDGSTTRRHEGTGIGLALVHELVGLHGGEVWAESDGVGSGSQFHVVLPVGTPDHDGRDESVEALPGDSGRLRREIGAIDPDDASVPSEQSEIRFGEMQRTVERGAVSAGERELAATSSKHDSSTPEVLVCEDNRDMRRLITHLVSDEYRVRVAINGREGLELARESEPDLILTDVMMPEMSGTELCRAIKSDPSLSHIPVILVTSKADREMKVEGLELGADDYVTKPFHPRELMARVRSLITLREARKDLDRQNALLESTNAELRAALQELHEAGVQLVKSERLAAVGELAAGVAHEINNPMNFAMNALRTMSDYVGDVSAVAAAYADVDWTQPDLVESRMSDVEKLRESCDFDEAAAALTEMIGIVTDGLERTQQLIVDLRDFAAPGDSPHADVDITRGLKTTVQLIGHAARDANVAIRLDIPDRLPSVLGDAGALNQVFLNLLKNATEVLSDHGGHIDVSAQVCDGSVLVEFRDDGPGVAHDAKSKVFEPFFTTKEAGHGTGLGLSISRRIVEEHGGDLEVISEEAAGAIFRVTLPCQDESGAA